jgi:hypothetical protein
MLLDDSASGTDAETDTNGGMFQWGIVLKKFENFQIADPSTHANAQDDQESVLVNEVEELNTATSSRTITESVEDGKYLWREY